MSHFSLILRFCGLPCAVLFLALSNVACVTSSGGGTPAYPEQSGWFGSNQAKPPMTPQQQAEWQDRVFRSGGY